jgi:DNA recombination protein RmuC
MPNLMLIVLASLPAVILAWLLVQGRRQGDSGLLADLRRREQETLQELARLRERLSEAEKESVKARTEALEKQARLEEERRLLEQAEAKLKEVFESLANKTLSSTTEALRRSSEASLNASKALLDQAAETRSAEIKGLLDPLKLEIEGMRQFGERLKGDEGALKAELARLSQETGQLSQTLRSSQGRGRYGEFVLERYATWAGLQKGVHYDTQVQTRGRDDDRTVKPDFVLHLSPGKDIIIDSKAVFEAYQNAMDEPDKERRAQHLAQHLVYLKMTINNLASKKYQDQFLTAPDFVVLFLPAEPLLEAALEQDPKLFEEAFQKKVVLATPSAMMAMLKVVHRAWTEATMAENAQAIVEQGQVLMDRLVKFMEHLALLGRKLDESVDSYNDAYGSLKKNLYPAIRDLKALGVAPTKTAKKESMPVAIESATRFKVARLDPAADEELDLTSKEGE